MSSPSSPLPPAELPYRGSAPTAPAVSVPARPYRHRELASVLAAVLLVDLCLLDADGVRGGGLGLAAVLSAWTALAYASARKRRMGRAALAVGFGLILVVSRALIDPTPLTVSVGGLLVLAWAIALRRPRALALRVLGSMPRSLRVLPRRTRAAATTAVDWVSASFGGRRPMLPVLVPAALTLCFVGLFALANPAVASLVSSLSGWVWDGVVLPGAVRVLLWVTAGVFAVGLMRPSVPLLTSSDELPADAADLSDVRLAVAKNTLVALNLLFLAYIVFDAGHLLSGQLPEGMTTQVYAHRGAFWLTVTLALLTAVVSVLFHGAMATAPVAALPRRLAMGWVAQGLVVGAGTYWRIGIHIQHSGLSNLRLVGVLGTSLVIFGALLVAAKLHRGRSFFWLLNRQLNAFAVVAVLFAVFPTHWVSAVVNVHRIQAGEAGPLIHMPAQAESPESAAELIELLDHPDPAVRRGVAVLLRRTQRRLERAIGARESVWQIDLLSVRALERLDAASEPIDALCLGVDVGYEEAVLHELQLAALGRGIRPAPTPSP